LEKEKETVKGTGDRQNHRPPKKGGALVKRAGFKGWIPGESKKKDYEGKGGGSRNGARKPVKRGKDETDVERKETGMEKEKKKQLCPKEWVGRGSESKRTRAHQTYLTREKMYHPELKSSPGKDESRQRKGKCLFGKSSHQRGKGRWEGNHTRKKKT